jgi:hypothetical protein
VGFLKFKIYFLKFRFCILQSFVQIFFYSVINGHFCNIYKKEKAKKKKKRKKRKPGHKKALLGMLRVLERLILQ